MTIALPLRVPRRARTRSLLRVGRTRPTLQRAKRPVALEGPPPSQPARPAALCGLGPGGGPPFLLQSPLQDAQPPRSCRAGRTAAGSPGRAAVPEAPQTPLPKRPGEGSPGPPIGAKVPPPSGRESEGLPPSAERREETCQDVRRCEDQALDSMPSIRYSIRRATAFLSVLWGIRLWGVSL